MRLIASWVLAVLAIGLAIPAQVLMHLAEGIGDLSDDIAEGHWP
jgi:hypothetical protein